MLAIFLLYQILSTGLKDNNIPVGPGRGSGAGSLAAWSLGITDLDPLNTIYYLKDVLNPERVSMPDFDMIFVKLDEMKL